MKPVDPQEPSIPATATEPNRPDRPVRGEAASRLTGLAALAVYVESAAVLAGTVALALLLTAIWTILAFGSESLADPEAMATHLRLLIPSQAILAALLVAVGLSMVRLRVRLVQDRPPATATKAVGWGLAAAAAALGVSHAVAALQGLLGWPVQEQEILTRLLSDPGHLLGLMPWLVVAAPLGEEVFFRGYILRFVGQSQGVAAGVLVSAVLFALVHGNPSGILVYVCLGAVFGLAYVRTNHLAAPIVAHALYNAASLALFHWLGPG